jgi:cell division protein FtsN
MVRQYQKKKARQAQRGRLRSLMLALVSFFSGYLVASFVDLGRIVHWAGATKPENSQLEPVPDLASHHTPKPKLEFYTLLTTNHAVSNSTAPSTPAVNPIAAPVNVTTLVAKSTPAAPSIPTPSLTPHTNDLVLVKKTATIASNKQALVKPVAPKPIIAKTSVVKTGYTIQVAALRTRQDAEKMKAAMLLKGLTVSVNPVMSQGTTWYRVIVGPFVSRVQAEQVQMVLARRDRMNGMIRKMDA